MRRRLHQRRRGRDLRHARRRRHQRLQRQERRRRRLSRPPSAATATSTSPRAKSATRWAAPTRRRATVAAPARPSARCRSAATATKNAMAGETCDTLGGADTAGCNGKNAGAVACKAPSCGDGYINGRRRRDLRRRRWRRHRRAATATPPPRSPPASRARRRAAATTTRTARPARRATRAAPTPRACNGNSAVAVAAGVGLPERELWRRLREHGAVAPAASSATTARQQQQRRLPHECKNASCGDGFVEAGVETCDTGSTSTSHGCASCFAADPGWTCTLPSPPGPSSCTPVCGDGDSSRARCPL